MPRQLDWRGASTPSPGNASNVSSDMRVTIIQEIPKQAPGKLQALFMLCLSPVPIFFCTDGKGAVLAGSSVRRSADLMSPDIEVWKGDRSWHCNSVTPRLILRLKPP